MHCKCPRLCWAARIASQCCRQSSTKVFAEQAPLPDCLEILGTKYPCDDWTNLTSKILSLIGRSLTAIPNNPLCLLKQRIVGHFHETYRKKMSTSPLFSFHEFSNPVVSIWENFDSLLVPQDHVSRSKRDSYYVNRDTILRAHTSAHQHALISSGRDQFLVLGDVYRRDQIDRTHFPAFHQMEGVSLFNKEELAGRFGAKEVQLFEKVPDSSRSPAKQERHTTDSAKLVEHDLKCTLEKLVLSLFGPEIEWRWTETYFPFTHPSWELEVCVGKDAWLETLGCGIVEQALLESAGAGRKVGWAFGLGLERLAMKLYSIPDIRLFWSRDTGFLSQFETQDPHKPITYKPISRYPQCINDLSFWLPTDGFDPADFYDLARSVADDMVEQVNLIDEFMHPTTGRISHCYRIIYRHMEKTLTQAEVNDVHNQLRQAVGNFLKGEVR